jgi:hypothetical protein
MYSIKTITDELSMHHLAKYHVLKKKLKFILQWFQGYQMFKDNCINL